MKVLTKLQTPETQTRSKILQAAQKLFAKYGYDGTTTRDLAKQAGVAESALYHHFTNKKAILIELATTGWVEILTDLLTELSEMSSYKAVAQVKRRRMLNISRNAYMMKVCFLEAQFHPELRDKIQSEVIGKMTDVAEAFFATAMERGVYRQMSPKLVARVFLGMFAIAGFSQKTLLDSDTSPQAMQEMAEGLADIFLNGVLASQEGGKC